MKHATLAVAIAFGLGACEKVPSTPTEVTVPYPAARVGDRETEVSEDFSTLTPSAAAEDPRPRTETYKFASTWEVLEVTDGAATKVKLRFERWECSHTTDGFDVPRWREVVLGKVYLLSGRETTFTATDAQGGSLTDLERVSLDELWGSALGERSGLRQVLASRAWKLGEKVVLSREDRSRLLAHGTAAALTLTSTDGKQATFELDDTVDPAAPGEIHKLSHHETIVVDLVGGHWMKRSGTLDKEFELDGEMMRTTSQWREERSHVPSPAARD